MTYTAPVLGLLAGVVGIADTIPYVRDTVRGSTRPHRGTWLIWSVLAIVACLSQRADGASWSLIMAAAQAVLTGVIFLLSIRRGEGGPHPPPPRQHAAGIISGAEPLVGARSGLAPDQRTRPIRAQRSEPVKRVGCAGRR
jgi:hypothetical protein